jgi:hypothetical protein
MSTLAEIPDLIGFFSYSREDDKGSKGSLSALRDAIQAELSAQLGRSQIDFRIWQDKAAISHGTLWEKQIEQGIKQSVFFIPIVTPRSLRSQNCGHEFQSFLARETELGRDDLVFPILYIPVPALEDEKLWRQDPVLNIVGTRQYLDWRDYRPRSLEDPEIRTKIIHFCRNISKALHKQWVPPEERERKREEDARQERRRKTAEIEIEQLASRHAAQEEALAAAKSAGTVAAIDAFLEANPAGDSADEARKLKSVLLVRNEAHGHAMASNDVAVLKSFLGTYRKGTDTDEIRARLRQLEPRRSAVRPAVFAGSALAAACIAAIVVWIAMRHGSNGQASVAAPPPAAQASASVIPPSKAPPPQTKTANAAPPVSVAPVPAAAPAPSPAAAPAPRPDELAWSLVNDTTDPAALRRFITEFPDSPRRGDAEARISALAAERTAWSQVKDSNDADRLRQFVQQFPNGPDRTDAEQRIASLANAAPAVPAVTAPDAHELARELQFELRRVGCFDGSVNGAFNDDTRAALSKFIKLTSASLPNEATSDAVNAVRAINKRVCPLICPHGEHAESGACVANEPPPKHNAPAARGSAPAPAPAVKCEVDRYGMSAHSGTETSLCQ